jgi:hypothetical protein
MSCATPTYETKIQNFNTMSTRLLLVVIAASLLTISGSMLATGEHPGPPQQSQSQQLPQGASTSSQSGTQIMEASQADLATGLKKYIDVSAMKSADRKFHVRYGGKNLALDLVKVHDDRFSSLGANKYFACVDMKGTDGKVYDIDFFMAARGRTLNVTETSVHKINGKPLYNWKEEKGVWKKVRVS